MAKIEKDHGALNVTRDSGHRLRANLVLVGIGGIANTELAAEAGLACNNGIMRPTPSAEPRIPASLPPATAPATTTVSRANTSGLNRYSMPRTRDARPAPPSPTNWSPMPACRGSGPDQYEAKLQIVGLSDGGDRHVIRGALDQGQFSVFIYRGDRLIAVDSINRPGEQLIARKLIEPMPRLPPTKPPTCPSRPEGRAADDGGRCAGMKNMLTSASEGSIPTTIGERQASNAQGEANGRRGRRQARGPGIYRKPGPRAAGAGAVRRRPSADDTERHRLKAASLAPRHRPRRILMTLEKGGFVSGDGKLFSLTSRVLALASAYLSSNQIVTAVQPMIDRVSTETKEVCSLAILDGEQAIFIARASPARVFSAGIDIGYRLPAFCTSVGRVLLGRLPPGELTAAIGRMNLVAQTPFTVTDKDVLLAAIITDRSKGYSLVDQEAEDGFRSLAVPVRRYDGEIVAAINVGAHVDRISTGEMLDRFLPPLKNAAAAAQPLLL